MECTVVQWSPRYMVSVSINDEKCSPALYSKGPGLGIGESLALLHGPLATCVKLRVAHAPGILETFSPPPRVSDPDMHHGTCVTHVP